MSERDVTGRVFCGQIAPLTSHPDLAVRLPPLFWSASIWCAALLLSGMSPARRLCAAETVPSKTTYQKAYGSSKGAPSVDAARELPRYPAVAPKDALKTWRVKAGFRLELAASEPQVRDPIAVCFDERGRMFVCEMIDYSEMRDASPHLGRVSVLEDKDGDGYYETSTVFADNLPWPTGLIWANGGLYVAATPDIWRFEDRDDNGAAEVRTRVFTGFGTGLKLLNVQSLLNSFQWGPDNRVHVLAGGGNRGVVTCPLRPELPGRELGGRDFWFDPLTHEFGLEPGGAQYGMSFDDLGRKFGCSNSDHLQYWVHHDPVADTAEAPVLPPPPPRLSIAKDGGAAEVFRLSPDEPWRIVRTRWRVAGSVPGLVEGGGRVSGYFTGATGTTLYRGDAYGPDFVNNSFTGDAGGQLVHRKRISVGPDGVALTAERPADEAGMEFAASTDTWVRVVNFANAPDGCLHVCDMYREVIEHPWSIPDEIKRHLDLNSGNDRGRIYRIVPDNPGWSRRAGAPGLANADTTQLVKTLAHPNGWHRDTASRLLSERRPAGSAVLLEALLRDSASALARLHALSLLHSTDLLSQEALSRALSDSSPTVRGRAALLAAACFEKIAPEPATLSALARLASDRDARVRFECARTAVGLLTPETKEILSGPLQALARSDHAHPWIGPALLQPRHGARGPHVLSPLLAQPDFTGVAAPFVSRLLELRAATEPASVFPELLRFALTPRPNPGHLRAIGQGLAHNGGSLEKADRDGLLAPVFAEARQLAVRSDAALERKLEALELLSVAPEAVTVSALEACLGAGQGDGFTAEAVRVLSPRAGGALSRLLLAGWAGAGPLTREGILNALLAREDRTLALLEAFVKGEVPVAALSPARVQALVSSKVPALAGKARVALAEVLPPSRESIAAKYQAAATLAGDAERGSKVYDARCQGCHRAAGRGLQVGPDLLTVKGKGREALLTAILEPNKEVASQYIVHTITTKAGDIYTGMIAEDTAQAVMLLQGGSVPQNIQRKDIKGSSSEGKSMMPEGLEAGLELQSVADLLTFIETLP
jgi:putative membrane-bound dehydrogenase-like protein